MSEANEPTDEDLVHRALNGEVTAFDTLLVRYQKRLYTTLYNMTSNHEDTNDLLMITFDKAFRNLSGFQQNSTFYSWIYRIAMNLAINHINSKKRKNNTIDMDLNDMDSDAYSKYLEDNRIESNPERNASLQDLQKKLNESLQSLSNHHRAVVVLCDIENMSIAEASKILKCSEGTVKSRLHYAHKELQKLLKGYLN